MTRRNLPYSGATGNGYKAEQELVITIFGVKSLEGMPFAAPFAVEESAVFEDANLFAVLLV